MHSLPYYKRPLDSFDDAIIVRCLPPNNGTDWYAVLDTGFDRFVSDPDFSTCAASRAEAVAMCAKKIRGDAPHSVTQGYDLHFRLARHWVMKERIRAAGLDPDFFFADVVERAEKNWDQWSMVGTWVNKHTVVRLLEAHLAVSLLDLDDLVNDGVDLHEVGTLIATKVRQNWASSEMLKLDCTTEETWKNFEARIDEYVANLAIPEPTPCP